MSPRGVEVTRAQRRYIAAFERLIAAHDRQAYDKAKSDLARCFRALYTERGIPEPERRPFDHDDGEFDRVIGTALAPPP